ARIGIHDLDPSRGAALAARAREAAPGCAASSARPVAQGYDIVINATPVGMQAGDGLPAPLGALNGVRAVVDIVPRPPVTKLLSAAAAAGCRTSGGQAMIDGQADAVLAFFGLRATAADAG
ncbi:MAG: shikimate dehydrogenase, partial [Rhodospirillales bacterium]|nr:shikimate dehydrogenase [Rhodospirillales bacterium]